MIIMVLMLPVMRAMTSHRACDGRANSDDDGDDLDALPLSVYRGGPR